VKEYFAALESQGAQRFYVWFADFAPPGSIAEFGESVIAGRCDLWSISGAHAANTPRDARMPTRQTGK
jgi:hypothetical protein